MKPLQDAFQRRGAGRAHAADRRHQQLQPHRRRLPRATRSRSTARRPDDGDADAGRSGLLRSAASEADPHRLPHARLGRRCRGCGAGRVPALARIPTAARCASREAFLRRVVTRLCLDVLKSARASAEKSISAPGCRSRSSKTEDDEIDDVTLPLMMALERLSPLERAAFILHDVFGIGFDEVAETIGRDAAACRQLASRARAACARRPAAVRCAEGARAGNRRRLLRGLAQRRHDGAAVAARRGRRDVFRWRRQTAGSVGADPRHRRW